MKFTVLGNNGPFAGAGNACSGYLLQTSEGNIMIDMGSGILSRYLTIDTLNNLKAVILTHLHYDHMSDMFTLKYALESLDIHNLPVYLPPEPKDTLIEREDSKGVFSISGIKSNLKILNLSFDFIKTVHPVDTYAVSFHLNDLKYTYTADSGYFEDLIGFARDSDVLISDTAFLSTNKRANIHMTAAESALLAKSAHASRLYLTHFYPFTDPELYLKEAKKVFSNTYLTKEMQSI